MIQDTHYWRVAVEPQKKWHEFLENVVAIIFLTETVLYTESLLILGRVRNILVLRNGWISRK